MHKQRDFDRVTHAGNSFRREIRRMQKTCAPILRGIIS
jgi:hypothetical protein